MTCAKLSAGSSLQKTPGNVETIRRALYRPEGGLNIDPHWKPAKVGGCPFLGISVDPTQIPKSRVLEDICEELYHI